MRELSASEILGVWERGRTRTLAGRALELLAAGAHAGPPERLSVGERDALLLDLREATFGPALEAVATCPSCSALLELELAADDLRGEHAGDVEEEHVLEHEGAPVRFRVPTAADLLAAAGAADEEEGREVLLVRCVLEPRELTPELADAVSSRMAAADPGAWIELALACPDCGEKWAAPFDVVAFLWAEVDACVRRLVQDVHALASAYGWRESDVLALSPARREAYLELAGA